MNKLSQICLRSKNNMKMFYSLCLNQILNNCKLKWLAQRVLTKNFCKIDVNKNKYKNLRKQIIKICLKRTFKNKSKFKKCVYNFKTKKQIFTNPGTNKLRLKKTNNKKNQKKKFKS